MTFPFCFGLQSYEKTSEKKRKACFSLSFPSASNFGEAKVTKKRVQDTILSLSGQNLQNLFFFHAEVE